MPLARGSSALPSVLLYNAICTALAVQNIFFVLGLIPKNSKVNLFQDLQDIGNWESLCTHLGVSEAVMDELRFANLQDTIKKERCLSAYIKSGKARWDHVVRVVYCYPFNNIVLGKTIAAKHNVPKEICEQNTKYIDL